MCKEGDSPRATMRGNGMGKNLSGGSGFSRRYSDGCRLLERAAQPGPAWVTPGSMRRKPRPRPQPIQAG